MAECVRVGILGAAIGSHDPHCRGQAGCDLWCCGCVGACAGLNEFGWQGVLGEPALDGAGEQVGVAQGPVVVHSECDPLGCVG